MIAWGQLEYWLVLAFVGLVFVVLACHKMTQTVLLLNSHSGDQDPQDPYRRKLNSLFIMMTPGHSNSVWDIYVIISQ